MKAQRSLGAVLEGLGIKETREAPDVGIVFSYAIPHLIRHPWPHGCGQHLLRATTAAVAGHRSGVRIHPGLGGFQIKLMAAASPAGQNEFSILARKADNLLVEAFSSAIAATHLPSDNGLGTTFTGVRVTDAVYAAVPSEQKVVMSYNLGIPALADFGDHLRIPRDHVVYLFTDPTNAVFDFAIIGWENCGD